MDNSPSFSIVLETENLANADVDDLVRSLASLAAQDPPPTSANEVLLIESGDTPEKLLQQLCETHPWIRVHDAPEGTTYYQAKMLGARLATGAIVVYYDSDCIYTPDWLRLILAPFQDERVQIVAGETTTGGQGAYGTAMALTYIFPQFSQQKQLTTTTRYFLNNVAFRREFLLQNPIPTEIPLYRGNCVVHAQQLLNEGYTIWLQPNARAIHSPPNGLRHFFWRFLLIGHDYYWQKQLMEGVGDQGSGVGGRRSGVGDRGLVWGVEEIEVGEETGDVPIPDPALKGWAAKLDVFNDRLDKMRRNKPSHLLYLPFALPIAMVAAFLIYAGYLTTSVQPRYLLGKYSSALEDDDKQKGFGGQGSGSGGGGERY
jgi:glycosyltransferase involved in cell wall biosynthesis